MVSQYCPATCSRWDCFSAKVQQKVEVLPAEVLLESSCAFVEGAGRWGTLVFSWRTDRFCYVWDQKSGDIYNDDSITLVWCKCALLIPITVLHVLAKAVSTVVRGQFFDAFRVMYYGTLCLGSALYGVVDPCEGRRLYSVYERAYFRDEDFVDRRNNTYMALCFVPLNYNAIDKMSREQNVQIVTRNALRHKYGVFF